MPVKKVLNFNQVPYKGSPDGDGNPIESRNNNDLKGSTLIKDQNTKYNNGGGNSLWRSQFDKNESCKYLLANVIIIMF
jgi:hypothetical protein